MYYVKQMDCSDQESAWNPTRVRSEISFGPLLYGQQGTLMSTDSARKIIADAGAAAITQAYRTANLSDEYVNKLLEYCHAAVQSIGYKTETIEEVAKAISGSERNMMLVLGCQTLKMLCARVNAGIEVVRRIGGPFEVVFVGCNPTPNATASIVNEAREMQVYFKSLIADDSLLSSRIGVKSWTEPASTDTKGNIKQFIDSGLLNGANNQRVLLVSSTFHLMRIAVELELYQEVMAQKNVRSIVLVGSESPYAKDQVKALPPYIKQLAFEVFYDIFKATEQDKP